VSYLSRRTREMREEETRRQGALGIDYAWPDHSVLFNVDRSFYGFVPRAAMMADDGMLRLREDAFDRYEETLRARTVNYHGRAG
jgi:hypothetical protein